MSLFGKIFDNKILENEPLYTGDVQLQLPPQSIPTSTKVGAKQMMSAGGKIKDTKMEYFQRWNIYFFIFFISIVLALLTLKSKRIERKLFKTTKPVTDMRKQNTKHIMNYTIVFICLILAYHIVLYIFAAGYLFLGKHLLKIPHSTKDLWKHVFWEYKDSFDTDITIGKNYLLILLVTLFVVFVFYIGFAKWFKGWYSSLYYESTNKKKQDTAPQSYAYFYAMFMIVMFLFMSVLLNTRLLSDNTIYMAYNIIFFIALLIMTFTILKELKNNNKKRMAFFVILVAMVFLAYPIVISLITLQNSAGDFFNADFLKNIIFNFSLNQLQSSG